MCQGIDVHKFSVDPHLYVPPQPSPVVAFAGVGEVRGFFCKPFGAKVWDPSMFNPVTK